MLPVGLRATAIELLYAVVCVGACVLIFVLVVMLVELVVDLVWGSSE